MGRLVLVLNAVQPDEVRTRENEEFLAEMTEGGGGALPQPRGQRSDPFAAPFP